MRKQHLICLLKPQKQVETRVSHKKMQKRRVNAGERSHIEKLCPSRMTLQRSFCVATTSVTDTISENALHAATATAIVMNISVCNAFWTNSVLQSQMKPPAMGRHLGRHSFLGLVRYLC